VNLRAARAVRVHVRLNLLIKLDVLEAGAIAHSVPAVGSPRYQSPKKRRAPWGGG
jgi:hypothetical protein